MLCPNWLTTPNEIAPCEVDEPTSDDLLEMVQQDPQPDAEPDEEVIPAMPAPKRSSRASVPVPASTEHVCKKYKVLIFCAHILEVHRPLQTFGNCPRRLMSLVSNLQRNFGSPRTWVPIQRTVWWKPKERRNVQLHVCGTASLKRKGYLGDTYKILFI